MSFRGTLSSGQAFSGQGDQMHGHQNGYPFQQHQQQHQQQQQQQSPLPENPQQPHYQQQYQQHQHQQPLQPMQEHSQQAVFSGSVNHGQQQYYQSPQAGQQQGFFLHPRQFQQQVQQQLQHPQTQPQPHPQQQPIMTFYNPNFDMYQNLDAGGHGASHRLQSSPSRYMPPPSTVWQQQQQQQQQQPMTQQVEQTLQQQNLQQPVGMQQAHQQQPPQSQQPPQPYQNHTPNTPIQPRPSPTSQQAPKRPRLSSPSQQQIPPHSQHAGISEEPSSQPLAHDARPPPEEQLEHKFHYVNLKDIQRQPLLPALPVLTKNKTNTEDAPGEPMDISSSAAGKPPPSDPNPIKLEEDIVMAIRIPQHAPEARPKQSPHSSVTNSPALSARSPSITRRSPAILSKPRSANITPLFMAVAEECLSKARAASHDVAMSLRPEQVDEYQKLITTGLSCLEAVIQSNQLAPREEARVRLRYASVLREETENLIEAETTLGKGITLCDKHRYHDLKYCMQYLMLQTLFQRNHKAALKAVDGHISNCETLKHIQWYYAFRLLKASFYQEMGAAADAGVLDNVRAIQNVANARGDNALSVFASILEGFILLKTTKDGSEERIQVCIAQIAKFQFDPTVQITQLTVLTLLLEVTASLHHQSPDHTAEKLRLLQKALDECEGWNNVKSDFAVPVKKQPSAVGTVSEDTGMVIQMGADEGETDSILMTFMTKMELKSLVFTISGLANFHKPSSQGRRCTEFWLEGLRILDTWDRSTAGIPYGHLVSLQVAMRQRAWRNETQAYLNTLLGLVAASHCQWANVKQVVQKLKSLVSASTQPTVRLLSIYLRGVYHQGIGDLQTAINIFTADCFAIPRLGAGTKAGQQEIALLAGLNRLWIMQHPSCRNDQETMALIEQLQPWCTNHWNLDLRTAWHNVMAALVTEPAQQLNQQKQHIHAAMAGSKTTNNVLGAALTLCIMRSRFFENVIGEQALKSARAAAKQAQRSGNVLWQSVADGMLAHSYEVQGQREEAKQEWDKATMEARDAFSRSL